jgi:hypothetical protein
MFICTVRIGDCPPLHLRHFTVDCVGFINTPPPPPGPPEAPK